jgi:hypothetical protein
MLTYNSLDWSGGSVSGNLKYLAKIDEIAPPVNSDVRRHNASLKKEC